MYRVCKLCGWQLQTGNGEDVQLASSVEPPLACVYPPVPATVIDNPAYCGDVAGWLCDRPISTQTRSLEHRVPPAGSLGPAGSKYVLLKTV
jgi:hypothetical protein